MSEDGLDSTEDRQVESNEGSKELALAFAVGAGVGLVLALAWGSTPSLHWALGRA